MFGETAFANANADALVFRDGAGNPVQYSAAEPERRSGLNVAVSAERLLKDGLWIKGAYAWNRP